MRDLKYLFAYSIPLSTFLSIYFLGIYSYGAVFYAFLVIPVLEVFISNPSRVYSEEEKSSRLSNILFDIMLFGNLPIVFGLLGYGFYVISSGNLTTPETVGIVLSLGILLATNGINVAHELGHRKTKIEQTMSKVLLMPCLYMHFYLEHNFGHHKNVATPEDPATSKYNQAVYFFWFTSVIKQYKNAWKIQMHILKTENSSFLSVKNEMLFYILFQGLYLSTLFYFLGVEAIYFGVAVGVLSFLFLETINYIEHYGLQRNKTESGRYERVQTKHSWNSNHIIGRIVLYELTRHSDHHFKASKKYQVLEHKDESPQLPFGYPTSILLTLVPPLWFRLMNSRIPKEMIPSV